MLFLSQFDSAESFDIDFLTLRCDHSNSVLYLMNYKIKIIFFDDLIVFQKFLLVIFSEAVNSNSTAEIKEIINNRCCLRTGYRHNNRFTISNRLIAIVVCMMILIAFFRIADDDIC